MKTIIRKYHPPTEFCVMPSLTYWEVDGTPVSSAEAFRAMDRNRAAQAEVVTLAEDQRNRQLLNIIILHNRVRRSVAKKGKSAHRRMMKLRRRIVSLQNKWLNKGLSFTVAHRSCDLPPTVYRPVHQVECKETEVARNLHKHIGWIEEVEVEIQPIEMDA